MIYLTKPTSKTLDLPTRIGRTIGATVICIAAAIVAPTAHAQGLTVDELNKYFSKANVLEGPTIVNCKLSGGTESSCFQITIETGPSSHELGPWCPETITDSAESGGIWLEGGEVHDVDGAFIENLADFYSDSAWQLYDPATGKIKVTDTYEKCAGAAKPVVEPEYQQHCVQCLDEYMDDDASVTYTIPLTPVKLDTPARNNAAGSGIAFNGIRLDASAPVADILGNYTLAPFDDCGGHINLHVGYHYHAATDCLTETAVTIGNENAIGLAMDGYWIFTRQLTNGSVPTDLDQCGGHITDEVGYHYHAGEQGANAILGCLAAEYGCVSEEQGQSCDASVSNRGGGPGGPGGGARPDFASAAKKLGISENELMNALGPPPPDFDNAASKLGVTAKELREAMGEK